MLFGGPCARPLPPYFVQYLHPIGFFFFSLLSSRPLFVQLWALRDVVLFRRVGGGGDQDLDREGDQRLCRLSSSFCFCRPSLSEVVAARALSSSLSDWCVRGAVCC